MRSATHRLWPASTGERICAYLYAALLALQLSVLSAAAGRLTDSARAVAVATCPQILLALLLLDSVVHGKTAPAPLTRTLAATAACTWNAALAAAFAILTATRGTFAHNPGVTWTLLAGYAAMAALCGWCGLRSWAAPLAQRPLWEMHLIH